MCGQIARLVNGAVREESRNERQYQRTGGCCTTPEAGTAQFRRHGFQRRTRPKPETKHQGGNHQTWQQRPEAELGRVEKGPDDRRTKNGDRQM